MSSSSTKLAKEKKAEKKGNFRECYSKSKKTPMGVIIEDLRRKNGLSQRDLAKRCNVTARYIGYIEDGTKKPSMKILETIAIKTGSIMVISFVDNPKAK